MTDDLCRASKKKKYASKAETDRAIAELARTNKINQKLSSYECPYCNHWHMTSKPNAQPATTHPQYLKHPKSRKSR